MMIKSSSRKITTRRFSFSSRNDLLSRLGAKRSNDTIIYTANYTKAACIAFGPTLAQD